MNYKLSPSDLTFLTSQVGERLAHSCLFDIVFIHLTQFIRMVLTCKGLCSGLFGRIVLREVGSDL